MKIGAVCELTKLSDRTVRYYIEEGLLQPQYTKNYIGRKNFDFSDGDVALLQNIAVLRKYGFSIIDIKTMLDDPTQSREITRQLIEKKKQTIQNEQTLLDTLLQLDNHRIYTVPALAKALDSPVLNDIEAPNDTDVSAFVLWFWMICILELVVGIPVTIDMFANWGCQFLYIKFYPLSLDHVVGFLRYIYPLICAGIMLLLYTKKLRKRRILHAVLTRVISIIYLVTWFPICLSIAFDPAPPIYSETNNIQNYLQVGSIEKQHIDPDLFPETVPEHALSKNGAFLPDTTRYYNITEMFYEGRYELFAQWQLSPEELDAEKSRIQQIFSRERIYVEENEEWTCWVYTNYPEDSAYLLRTALEGQGPQKYDRYDCTCFAFRERDGLVRYIASYSFNNLRMPIFTQLDWS